MDLEAWIKSTSASTGEANALPVAMASEIADVATRYVQHLDAGDTQAASAELVILRELCEERSAALRTLPKRTELHRDRRA